MKKIALATLLAATTLVATAQVSVSGKISTFVDNTKVGAVSATSLATDPTSNITFSATENIGGGLKARVVLDTSLAANDPTGSAGTKLGDRQSTIGLANRLGSVDLGRNLHSHFLAITNNDAFGTLYGSIAGDVHNLRGLRLSNGTFFALTPIKGVTATYDRTQTGAGTEATSYSASAKVLGVNAVVAQYTQGVEKSTVYGASTKLGAAQLFYTHSDDQSTVKSKGDLVGIVYPLTSNVVTKASYGRQSKDPLLVVGPCGCGPQEKTTAYSLGADYNFSKRTAVGIAYRNVDVAGTANDVKQVGVGVTHRF
jgi:predicted porin